VCWRVSRGSWPRPGPKTGLVLSAAELDEPTKACAALAVAMNAHSAYLNILFESVGQARSWAGR